MKYSEMVGYKKGAGWERVTQKILYTFSSEKK